MVPKVILGVVVLAVIGSILGSHHGSSSSASSSGSGSRITVLRGSGSDNRCEESDGDARIYVTITLRNSGDEAGSVNPWAAFDYSDGGNSTESYDTNYGHDLEVPAHTEVDATFYHTFNPQQHSLIRCTGYADLYDSSGPGYYLPTG